MSRKMIYVSSPYRSYADNEGRRKLQVARNIGVAKTACERVARLGAIPIAPHLYFTQFLNDDDSEDRVLGMKLGLDVLESCDELWLVTDSLISTGMMAELEKAVELNLPVRVFDSMGNENPAMEGFVKLMRVEKADADNLDSANSESTDTADTSDADKKTDDKSDSPMDELFDILLGALLAVAKSKDSEQDSKHGHIVDIHITKERSDLNGGK